MTRTLLVRLITLGDPERLSGGYLYHRRLAQLAPEHGAELRFVSVPEWPFPLPALAGGAVLRRALGPVAAPAADVVVLDSIAAGFLGPWLALRRPPVPLVGSLHQPPGGIDHGRVRRAVQAPLDRLAYRRAALLLVASQALAEQVETAGLLASRIRVVPPGRDVAAAPGAPAGDLRAGPAPGGRRPRRPALRGGGAGAAVAAGPGRAGGRPRPPARRGDRRPVP